MHDLKAFSKQLYYLFSMLGLLHELSHLTHITCYEIPK